MATKKKTTSKKTSTPKAPKIAVAVICGYCGDSQVFDSTEAALKWIKEDMQYNSHDEEHYTIVVGHVATLKVNIELVEAKVPSLVTE